MTADHLLVIIGESSCLFLSSFLNIVLLLCSAELLLFDPQHSCVHVLKELITYTPKEYKHPN